MSKYLHKKLAVYRLNSAVAISAYGQFEQTLSSGLGISDLAKSDFVFYTKCLNCGGILFYILYLFHTHFSLGFSSFSYFLLLCYIIVSYWWEGFYTMWGLFCIMQIINCKFNHSVISHYITRHNCSKEMACLDTRRRFLSSCVSRMS